MGQLTAPGTGLMDGNGVAMMIGSPQQVLGARNRQIINAAKSPRDVSFDDSGNASMSGPDLSKVGQIGQPSYQEAASAGGRMGAPNAMSPGLSKVGKLATILGSAAQGGLAGMAANAQGYQQSGRNGGFGAGFSGGYNLPFTRSMQQQQLQQAQAQTALTQAQAQQVMTPFGAMPAGLARYLFPAQIRAQAELGKTEMQGQTARDVAQTRGQSQVEAAGTSKRFVPVPGVGLFDTTTRQVQPGTAQGIVVTPDIAKEYQLPADFIGKPMTLQNLAEMERSQAFQEIPVSGANGPALVNRKTGQTRNLGLGSPAMAGITVAAMDPSNPGNLSIVPKTQAVGAMAPGSAPAQTAKATARAMAPGGKVGEELNAFSTAMQHADLLRKAAKALQNGDVRTVNSLSNRAKSEFGDPALTDFTAISHVYNNEIQKMIAGGHITNQEIGTNAQSLPDNANFETINKVLNSYQSLAQSKLNIRKQGVEKGLKGQANFPTQGGTVRMRAPNGQMKDVDPSQVEHFKSLGATVAQ